MHICRTLIIWYLFCFYLLQCTLFQLTVQNLQSFLTFSLNEEAKVNHQQNNHLDFILQNAKKHIIPRESTAKKFSFKW